MKTAKLKTHVTEQRVSDFLQSITDKDQLTDAKIIDALMQKITGEAPKMWGSSIIGYGLEHLVYESGRELDWMKIGFSPRKGNLTLYILRGGPERYEDLLKKLGKYNTGKGCLYINHLKDVDMSVLQQIIERANKRDHSVSL